MGLERASTSSSLIDVLDRVIDKGIVIDAWVRVSLVGIDLITVEARVVVASFETYLKYADAFAAMGRPATRSVIIHGGAQVEVSHELPPAAAQAGARARRHNSDSDV